LAREFDVVGGQAGFRVDGDGDPLVVHVRGDARGVDAGPVVTSPDPGTPAGPERVTLIAHGREVTIESGSAKLSEVVEFAVDLWARAAAAPDPRPRAEAGGMGFETERAPGAVFDDDAPGTVRL
jgi:hypothetical protein